MQSRVIIEGRSGKASFPPFLIQVFFTVVLSVLVLEGGTPNSNPFSRRAWVRAGCESLRFLNGRRELYLEKQKMENLIE